MTFDPEQFEIRGGYDYTVEMFCYKCGADEHVEGDTLAAYTKAAEAHVCKPKRRA